MIFRNVEK